MPNHSFEDDSNMPIGDLLTTPYAWICRLFSPNDSGTWMTNDGTVYDDVEVINIGSDMVTFRYRHGTASELISGLPDEVQRSLRDHAPAPRGSSLPVSALLHSLSKAG